MENQHKLIKGYRELSQEEIDLMNEVKTLENQVNLLLRKVETMSNNDGRSVSIARTNIQTGFMWLVRAIAKPQSF